MLQPPCGSRFGLCSPLRRRPYRLTLSKLEQSSYDPFVAVSAHNLAEIATNGAKLRPHGWAGGGAMASGEAFFSLQWFTFRYYSYTQSHKSSD
jgi:hypothetical protein